MAYNYLEAIEKKYLTTDNRNFRFGSIEDGGYSVNIKALEDADILFSGGISSNVEFEYDFYRFNKNIKILMVDPTVSGKKLFAKGITRFFLKKRNKIHYLFNTLIFNYLIRQDRCWHISKWLSAHTSIFDMLREKIQNPDSQKIILKLDIEGSEYSLLNEILSNLNRFNCIVMEFHDLDKKHEIFENFLENCSSQFKLTSLVVNPAGGFDEHKRCKNVEITLTHNRYFQSN